MVALSFARVARARGRRLLVAWPRTQECAHGLFTDAFEPIDGVEFVESLPPGVKPQFAPPSSDFHPDVKGTPDEDGCYALLRPNARVRAAVDAALARCGAHYASVHIRRTDHWASRTTDDDFEAFIGAQPPEVNCYVATDNCDTQAAFLRRFPARGRVHRRFEQRGDALRQTDVADAAVDLFVCSRASAPFMGTPSSSFSDTVVRLRRVGGREHADDRHFVTDALLQAKLTVLTPGGHQAHSAHGMARSTYCDARDGETTRSPLSGLSEHGRPTPGEN